eukprot:Phypoly_transcript_05498.p1 GENE.Phypoly_transcript_05498~~Phypoly_transcript_05498.p1  ORF type:complete len:280 (+),score=27.42 Phypoly_transcript_05498:54-842(+)
MGAKRMLTAWIEMLELANKDTNEAIRQVIEMIQQLDIELAKPENAGQVEAPNSETFWGDPVLTIAARMKPEIMMMSKITPALSVEVNCPKKNLGSDMFWLVQVVCAEHQHKWEIATCTEGKKRGRTEFTTDLVFPALLTEDTERGCCTATLPYFLLQHEQGLKERSAWECHLNGHRFQFRVTLLNEHHDPISPPVDSTSFLLASYTSGRSVDQYILKQGQKARRVAYYIKEKEILDCVNNTKNFLLEERYAFCSASTDVNIE